jgi:putative SOS response-associated peptidase YedK
MTAGPCLTDERCAELHHRMPVVLDPETRPGWLGEELADAQRKAQFAGPG